MSNSVVVRNLAAGTTYIDLPSTVTKDARIEVTFQDNKTGNIKAKQDVNNPSRLLLNTPMQSACSVVIEIEQDESFSSSYTTKVADYDSSRNYVRGALVFNKGRVYRACNDIPLGIVFRTTNVPNATGQVWYNTAGDTGSVIESILTLTVNDGYWPLDGTTINASWSALHTVATPDTRQKVLVGAYSGLAANDYKSPLQYSGSSTYQLSASNLPNGSFNVSIPSDGGHTPSGSVSVSQHNAYRLQSYRQLTSNNNVTPWFQKSSDSTGNPDGAGDNDGGVWWRQYHRGREDYFVYADVPAQGHSASFSGNYVNSHSHSGASVTLNSNTVVPISVMQPQMSINRYVRL